VKEDLVKVVLVNSWDS